VRDGGRIAYPNGVDPIPRGRPGVDVESYDGTPDPDLIDEINELINAGPFYVHISQTFRLDQAAAAHRALEIHHLGKIALQPSSS
jgi:NADPH:quinone reductase-like Zn-dependent oxidoreductase